MAKITFLTDEGYLYDTLELGEWELDKPMARGWFRHLVMEKVDGLLNWEQTLKEEEEQNA